MNLRGASWSVGCVKTVPSSPGLASPAPLPRFPALLCRSVFFLTLVSIQWISSFTMVTIITIWLNNHKLYIILSFKPFQRKYKEFFFVSVKIFGKGNPSIAFSSKTFQHYAQRFKKCKVLKNFSLCDVRQWHPLQRRKYSPSKGKRFFLHMFYVFMLYSFEINKPEPTIFDS